MKEFRVEEIIEGFLITYWDNQASLYRKKYVPNIEELIGFIRRYLCQKV